MCNIVEYVTLYFANLFHLIRIYSQYSKIFRFTMFVNIIMLFVKLVIRNVNIVG